MPPRQKMAVAAPTSDAVVSLGGAPSISEVVASAFELMQDGQSGVALDKLVAAFASDLEATTEVINQCISLTLTIDGKSSAVEKIREFVANALYNITTDAEKCNTLISCVVRNLASNLTNTTKIVRANACDFLDKVLYSLSDEAELDADVFELCLKGLLERLNDKQAVVREKAILALGRFVEEEGVFEKLMRVMESDPAAEVRIACFRRLPREGEYLRAILRRIRDVDPSVRREVCEYLANTSSRRVANKEKVHLLATALADRDKTVAAAALHCLFKLLEKVSIVDFIDACEPASCYADCERVLAAVVANARWRWLSECFAFKLGVPVYAKAQAKSIITAPGLPAVEVKLLDYVGMLEKDATKLDAWAQAQAQALEEDAVPADQGDPPVPTLTLGAVMLWRQLVDASHAWPLPGYGNAAHIARMGSQSLPDDLMPSTTSLGKAIFAFSKAPEVQRELLLLARHVDCADEYSADALKDDILDCLEAEDTNAANIPLLLTTLRLAVPEEDPAHRASADGESEGEEEAAPRAPQRRVRLRRGALQAMDARTSQRLTSSGIGRVLSESVDLFVKYLQQHSPEQCSFRASIVKEVVKVDYHIRAREAFFQSQFSSVTEAVAELQDDEEYTKLRTQQHRLEKRYRYSMNVECWAVLRVLLLAHHMLKFATNPLEDALQPVGPSLAGQSLFLTWQALWLGLTVDYYSADIQALCVETIALLGSLSTETARVYAILAMLLALAQPDGYIAPPPAAVSFFKDASDTARYACVGPASSHEPMCPCHEQQQIARAHGNVDSDVGTGCFGSVVHPRVRAAAVAGLCDVLLAHEALFTGEDTETVATGSILPLPSTPDASLDHLSPLEQLRTALLEDVLAVLCSHASTCAPADGLIKRALDMLWGLRAQRWVCDRHLIEGDDHAPSRAPKLPMVPQQSRWVFDPALLFATCSCPVALGGVYVAFTRLPLATGPLDLPAAADELPLRHNVMRLGHMQLTSVASIDVHRDLKPFLKESLAAAAPPLVHTIFSPQESRQPLPPTLTSTLPLAITHSFTAPVGFPALMARTSVEGLARALLYDRLPLAETRVVLARLLALHVGTRDAHVKQVLAVFWPAYAQSGHAATPFSEKGLRGARVPATVHGHVDGIERLVGFGVGVARDYNNATEDAAALALSRTMDDDTRMLYNLCSPTSDWLLSQGIGQADHLAMLVAATPSALLLLADTTFIVPADMQVAMTTLLQLVIGLIAVRIVPPAADAPIPPTLACVTHSPFAPLACSVTPLLKLFFDMFTLLIIMPSDAVRTAQVLSDALAKMLPCAAADLYPINTRDAVPDETSVDAPLINTISKYDRARLGICAVLMAIDEAFRSCSRNKIAQKALDRAAKALDTAVDVNGGFATDINGGMGGLSRVRHRQMRDEEAVQQFIREVGGQRAEMLSLLVNECADDLWSNFECALSESVVSKEADEVQEPKQRRSRATQADKSAAPAKTASRGRGRTARAVKVALEDEEEEQNEEEPRLAAPTKVKGEPVQIASNEPKRSKRAKPQVKLETVDLVDTEDDGSDSDLEVIAVRDASKRR